MTKQGKIQDAAFPKRPRVPEDVRLEYASFFLAARRTQKRIRARDRIASQLGLRTDAWRILLALNDIGPMPSIRLCEYVFMDRAAVSRAIARMETDELVVRVADAADKRVSRIHLTEQGRTKGKQISELVRQRECALMSAITDEEFDTWLRISDKLERRLTAMDKFDIDTEGG